MAEPILSLRGLSKAFGAVIATDTLDLDVETGTCHAVIGPNGAGKTTLIGQIAGELAPDAGRIVFDGRDITHTPAHARAHMGLARSFQITNVLPGFTALENVALAIQLRTGGNFRMLGAVANDTGLNARAFAALERVGLPDRAGTRASRLAHGEKRALELAMAMAQEPRLLLLDEPMAGTGADETERMVALIRTLADRATILLIEHDMDAVFALADRVTVLVAGRALATGTVDDIRADAEVRAAYLGEDGT